MQQNKHSSERSGESHIWRFSQTAIGIQNMIKILIRKYVLGSAAEARIHL